MTRMPSLKVFLGAGLIALLVNTGYISAFATPSIFYMMMVLAHLVLGLAHANALLVVPEDVTEVPEGGPVEVMVLERRLS